MKEKFKKYFPAGYEYGTDISVFRFGMAISTIWSMKFIVIYFDCLSALYENYGGEKFISPGAKIAPFHEILGSSLTGFIILIFIMLSFTALHYSYYYKGSHSIYLMKRLPQKHEIFRTCGVIPITAATISFITGFVLFWIYLAVYMFVTPDVCLPQNAWENLWRIL